MNAELFERKHALWLKILFTSFMVEEARIKSELYDFSQIAFRHMRWLSRELRALGTAYTYEREATLGKPSDAVQALETLAGEIAALSQTYPASALCARMATDDRYMLLRLRAMMNAPGADTPVTAFSLHRALKDKPLDKKQTDALTLFLFEESYKEYELILVYAYMQNHSDDALARDVYQDLIDESHFHLKSFGELMARMGILALPRPLHEHTYRIEDVERFIHNGIEEEENAKEQCRALAEAIRDEELSAFFDFINHQESYHIELMKKLLD